MARCSSNPSSRPPPVVFTLVIAALMLSGGCGTTPADGPSGAEPEVRRALARLEHTYENLQPEEFFDGFDRTRFPDFEGVRARLRETLQQRSMVALEFVIDQVLVERPGAAVQVRWDRSFVDPDGQHHLESGRSELLFQEQADGVWKLRALRGDSPF